MRGLYAIADAATLVAHRLDPVAFAAAVLEAHPAALQLRAKEMASADIERLLRQLVPMCRRARVPLFANDSPDAARRTGCDGVHVGQNDASIDSVRSLAPGLQVGLSTHTLEQLEVALLARPTYVAFGPVFATSSKASPDPVVGVEGVRAARVRLMAAGIPLVAIGGITRKRAPQLIGLVDAVAVIGEIVPTSTDPAAADGAPPFDQVTARARALHAMFAPPTEGNGVSAGFAR